MQKSITICAFFILWNLFFLKLSARLFNRCKNFIGNTGQKLYNNLDVHILRLLVKDKRKAFQPIKKSLSAGWKAKVDSLC